MSSKRQVFIELANDWFEQKRIVIEELSSSISAEITEAKKKRNRWIRRYDNAGRSK